MRGSEERKNEGRKEERKGWMRVGCQEEKRKGERKPRIEGRK